MSGLLYREDLDEVRKRLTVWWNGGDIGRPAMLVNIRRPKPLPTVPAMPKPAGWITDYSISNLEYRVNMAARGGADRLCLGDNVPYASPDLAPNCLALYLGCKAKESPGTVWCEPFITEPKTPDFKFDPDNIYWKFTLRLANEMKRVGKDKFLLHFPDLIEGLDTLAGMRGTEELLYDLIERPEWGHACLRSITDLYFHYYDILYNLMRDEVGGSCFWMWAPGRMAKFQCDFSAMISPDMFGEFMVPVLKEMCERVSYCMYHWDGPGAIPHHDHLLSIPGLKMIQWMPGAGTDPEPSPRWWPLYHKTFDAGKKIFMWCGDEEALRKMKKEFGQQFKQFAIAFGSDSLTPAQAEELVKSMCV
jgi:hypothetical protein